MDGITDSANTGAAGAQDLGGNSPQPGLAASGQTAENAPAPASAPGGGDAQKTQDGDSKPASSLLAPEPKTGPAEPATDPAAPPTDPLDQPLADLKDFTASLWPDQKIDPDLLQSFGQQAIKAGLSARQARELVDWQLEALGKAREAMHAAGLEALKKEWGANAEQNRLDTLALIASIDRQLGDSGRFSKALEATGAGLDPAIIAGLGKVAAMLGEDRLRSTSGGSAPQTEETPLDGIRAAYAEARQKAMRK